MTVFAYLRFDGSCGLRAWHQIGVVTGVVAQVAAHQRRCHCVLRVTRENPA